MPPRKHENEESSGRTGLSRGGRQEPKRPPGRPRIPLDRIIDAAIEVIDAQGVDALSLRTLALHLESGTATLYRHFGGRVDLIRHVVDRLLGEVPPDSDGVESDDWQGVLAFDARSTYAILRRHKGIAALLNEAMPDGPNSMAQRERIIAALLAGGFDPKTASRAYATLARFVLGFAIQSDDRADPGPDDDQTTSAYLGVVDPERYPALHAVAEHLPVGLDDEFEFGLQLILSGLTLVKSRQP